MIDPCDPILVTGGGGFLGQHVVKRLWALGYQSVIVPRKRVCDLRDRDVIRQLLGLTRPTAIVHLAAAVGGIGANQDNPATFFYDNAVMGLHLMEEARQVGVSKFLTVGSLCEYPASTPVPFKESDLWNGYPEPVTAPYGLAKRMLLVQGQVYAQQYGFKSTHLLMANLYGPGDHYDPRNAHVIPMLIEKCLSAIEAGHATVTCWGTGTPTRDFLYVEDAADAVVCALQTETGSDPINVGTGRETAIREVMALIAWAVGFGGTTAWDSTQPGGQSRRCVDVSTAQSVLGFSAQTRLEEGILRTVGWQREHRVTE